ncbi:polysaccharide biosynthesis/export family protein [Celeribacter indicus]|uniref:polysaccharide biosynthesis/export family protein n=1 Tax=Celeribacter indicus TaxID=1208324 RepID=UPI0005C34008|nr:polysaccharide biosynthesis/export family protein [Celeribacter indicus]
MLATFFCAIPPLLAAGPALTQEAGAAIAAPADDVLGSGDMLELRVVSWSEEALEYRAWDAVSGEYRIREDGRIALPLVGRFEAGGKALSQLIDEVTFALQERTKMVEPPSVAIEVLEYGPFFVLGDVAQPGQYEAAPGRTVYQAFALAGGAPRVAGGADANIRALMTDSGNLSQLRRELTRAEVKAARYRAQLADEEDIAFPDGLAHPDGAGALAALIAGERALYHSEREARALEVENLEELKSLLRTEIEMLQSKQDGLATQIDLARENLANIESLRESGLARSVQIRDAQEALFEVESQEIDLETGIFRARQRLKEADRDILALKSRYQVEAARELQTVNGTLEELRLRRSMLAGLVEAAGGEATTDLDSVETLYFLTRAGDAAGERPVMPDTVIGRGDVLRVERLLSGRDPFAMETAAAEPAPVVLPGAAMAEAGGTDLAEAGGAEPAPAAAPGPEPLAASEAGTPPALPQEIWEVMLDGRVEEGLFGTGEALPGRFSPDSLALAPDAYVEGVPLDTRAME